MVEFTDKQDTIEVLSEILGSLRITKEYALEGNRTRKIRDKRNIDSTSSIQCNKAGSYT